MAKHLRENQTSKKARQVQRGLKDNLTIYTSCLRGLGKFTASKS